MRSAETGQASSSAGARGIGKPWPKGSVFDWGRWRITDPSGRNDTDWRERHCCGENSSQASHVNSPGRRKAAKATVKAALRLTSS